MQTEDVRLYCGAGNETTYTHPANAGEYACIAPIYGRAKKYETRVHVDSDCQVLQDSGAFSDNTAQRLTFAKALERQNKHADKWGYADLIEAQASYDWLVDELWIDGARHKIRASPAAAEMMVAETVAAAKWIDAHREYAIAPRLVISAQGSDDRQYLDCTQRLMPYMRDNDIFGLGGWCIIGKMPRVMMPIFEATMKRVIPFLGREGIKRVHVWGVCYAPALGMLLAAADEWGIDVSTDTAGAMLRPTLGQWGYDDWWELRPKPDTQESTSAAMTAHVKAVRSWLATLRQSRHYRLPAQLTLF